MATVYLAHDIKHDRDVAIKVLHPDLVAADGLLYYVMPYVRGKTFRAKWPVRSITRTCRA